MTDERIHEMIDRLRDAYHPPGDTPREEMWAHIEASLKTRGSSEVHLDVERRKRRPRLVRPLGWAAGAAAVLAVGVGLGRMTAPPAAPEVAREGEGSADVLQVAAAEHLGRSESLLTLVRADARSGRVDPAVGRWARGLLTQTRLLLDTAEGDDPALRNLLEDLELVLVQVVGVAGLPTDDPQRVRSELTLALEGLERHEILPRIQAVTPAGRALAGT
jgi:hypothetical protein